MSPILFPENETEFLTNGIGVLSDAISCYVVEELNGSFELEMEYPVDGIHAEELLHSRLILAKPSDDGDPEPFRIYQVTKPLNGIVTVCAEHISYQLNHTPCAPFTASNAAIALQGLKQNAAEDCPFEFYTDKETLATYEQTEPASIRQRLGGVRGSILDVYGGEYKFNRWRVSLLAHRGTDRGVTLRYGKNITDIEQEEHIQNTITGVYPFWKSAEDELVELPEKVVSSETAANFPFHRTVVLDLSADWEEAPTEEQLRGRAQTYISQTGIGIPKVSIKVSFIPLWQTEEYKDVAALERVALGDVVTIIFEKLDITAYAKVERTDYDVLQERYRSIEVGEGRANFVKSVVASSSEVNQKLVEQRNFTNQAINNATNMITGAKGGNIRTIFDADNNPVEQVIMDTKDIMTAQKVWRWNLGGLGYSKTGYDGDYGLAITQDGAIVADFITVGTLDANLLRAGTITDRLGNTTWDLENGIITSTQLQVNSTHFNLSKTGNLEATEANVSGTIRTGSLDGYNIRLSGDSIEFLFKDEKFAGIRASANNYNVKRPYFEGTGVEFGTKSLFSSRSFFTSPAVHQNNVGFAANSKIQFGGNSISDLFNSEDSDYEHYGNKARIWGSSNELFIDGMSDTDNVVFRGYYNGTLYTFMRYNKSDGKTLFENRPVQFNVDTTIYASNVTIQPSSRMLLGGGESQNIMRGHFIYGDSGYSAPLVTEKNMTLYIGDGAVAVSKSRTIEIYISGMRGLQMKFNYGRLYSVSFVENNYGNYIQYY